MILYYVSVDITWNFWNVIFPRRKAMLMETEYIKMKCKKCGYEEWAEEEIADELATYNRKTKKYERLLECPKCHGVMIWHNKEKKVEQWESGFNPEDLPF